MIVLIDSARTEFDFLLLLFDRSLPGFREGGMNERWSHLNQPFETGKDSPNWIQDFLREKDWKEMKVSGSRCLSVQFICSLIPGEDFFLLGVSPRNPWDLTPLIQCTPSPQTLLMNDLMDLNADLLFLLHLIWSTISQPEPTEWKSATRPALLYWEGSCVRRTHPDSYYEYFFIYFYPLSLFLSLT